MLFILLLGACVVKPPDEPEVKLTPAERFSTRAKGDAVFTVGAPHISFIVVDGTALNGLDGKYWLSSGFLKPGPAVIYVPPGPHCITARFKKAWNRTLFSDYGTVVIRSCVRVKPGRQYKMVSLYLKLGEQRHGLAAVEKMQLQNLTSGGIAMSYYGVPGAPKTGEAELVQIKGPAVTVDGVPPNSKQRKASDRYYMLVPGPHVVAYHVFGFADETSVAGDLATGLVFGIVGGLLGASSGGYNSDTNVQGHDLVEIDTRQSANTEMSGSDKGLVIRDKKTGNTLFEIR